MRRDGKIEDHSVYGDQVGRALEPFQSRDEGSEIIRNKADIPRRVVGAVWAPQEKVVVGRGGVFKHGKQDVEHRKPGDWCRVRG